MIWCLSDPSGELRDAVVTLKAVGELVRAGDLQAARDAVDAIEEEPPRLRWSTKNEVRERRGYKRYQRGQLAKGTRLPPPSANVQNAVYRRDGWHCRYCQIEVLDPFARRHVVSILNSLGSGPLWGTKDHERHAALLNLSASYDHVDARSNAVTPDEGNLVTACWFCQFGKGAASLDLLDLHDPRDREPIQDEWDGWSRVLTVDPPTKST